MPPLRTSIVIPVFNRAHLVHRAVDSALEQTVPCEVLLVDHGSTDGIAAVAARYGSRIRYIRREQDRGAFACWRDGIEQATGELVHITYDDDWLQPTFIERCQPLLTTGVAFVYTQATVHDPDDRPVELINGGHPPGVRPIRDIVNYLLRAPLGISPGCALFRRADALRHLLLEVPGAPDHATPGAGVDLLLFLLTSLHYPRYAHVPEPLADFLAHPESITIGAHLTGRMERLAAAYSAAKAFYLSQPGAQRRSPFQALAQRIPRSAPRPSLPPREGRPVYFSPHYPWPPRHGAHHRILQTLHWIVDRYGPVHMVLGRQSNDNGRRGTPPRELVEQLTVLDLAPSAPDRLARRLGLQTVVDRTTFHSRAAFRRLLAKEKPAVVFMNYVYWGRLVPRRRDFFAILDTHDVVCHTEHLLRRLEKLVEQPDIDAFADLERDPPRLDRTVPGCGQEFRTLDAFDLVLAISRADQAFLAGALHRATVQKLGYHVPFAEPPAGPASVDGPRGLCPVGKGPNLFNEVGLRALDRAFGRLPSASLCATATGAVEPRSLPRQWCKVRGLVRDYATELASHQFGIMVAFTGTGAQIKQYEFAQAGLPVVGYRNRVDPDLFTDGLDAVLVDHPDQMCRAILQLVQEPARLAQLTAAARQLPARLRELRAREEAALQALLPESDG